MVPETINLTLSTETNFLASCKVLTGDEGGRGSTQNNAKVIILKEVRRNFLV